ncbi:MAG: amidohydrolase family protein [Chitinophagaceae bacterium]|nr:amidohydrolase family protein [Chitinophagaceae bacterium]
MNWQEFALNPADYGIPNQQQLQELRIWSDHYHGFWNLRGLFPPLKQHEEMMKYVKRMGIEKVISLDIGGDDDTEALKPTPIEKEEREILENNKDHILGIMRVDAEFPEESCAKMEKWIRNGPCIGIKFLLQKNGYKCSHPNADKIVRLAEELGAAIYVHTFLKAGGNPKSINGGNSPGEATPMDVTMLAKRFPNVPMICGHSGGDWELGARAVRPYENVLFEFAGSWPHSGSVDYAVNELGADRIVWGDHGPSRSFSTELSKVLDASISKSDRMKILGENYRRTWAKMFKSKNIPA